MLQPICLRPSPSTFIYNNRYRCPSLKWGGMENEKKREAECESKRWSAKEGWKSKEEVTILHRYPSPFSRSLSHTPVRRRARCLVKGRLQMSIVSLRCWQRKEDIMRGRKKWQAGRCAARLSCTWICFYSGTSFSVIFSQVKWRSGAATGGFHSLFVQRWIKKTPDVYLPLLRQLVLLKRWTWENLGN